MAKRSEKFKQTTSSYVILVAVASTLFACAKLISPKLLGQEFAAEQTSLTAVAMLGSAVKIGDEPVREAWLRPNKARQIGWQEFLIPEAHADVAPSNDEVDENRPSASCGNPSLRSCIEGVAEYQMRGCRRGGLEIRHLDATLQAAKNDFCPTNWKTFFSTPGAEIVHSFNFSAETSAGNLLNAKGDEHLKQTSNGALLRIDRVNYSIMKPKSQTSAFMEWLLPTAHADIAPPSASDSEEILNQTMTSDELTLTLSGTSGSTKVLDSGDGLVTVQEKLKKFTSKSRVSGLTWDHSAAGCGCFPISGSVSTTFTGSKTGNETVTFDRSACGAYSIQQTDASGNAIGEAVRGTLNSCL